MMLRDYQQRAIDQLYAWFESGNTGNPCLVLPTGAGKSHIIAALVKDALHRWPDTRVLMLTHQKELIEQNAEKLRQHWPRAPLGIYSASLGRRCLTEPITYAGIQSVAKRAADIGHVDLIIIDECHTINLEQTGTYRRVLSELTEINPHLRVIGLTASPYRLGQGMIHEGDNAIFADLIEPVTIEQLVSMGHLSVLRSKHTALTLDTTGVRKSGGEFVASALEAAVDTDANNAAAVREIVERGADRRSWLVFCSGVSHAEHLRDMLRQRGISAECVTGSTPKSERERILRLYKAGAIRCITNVSVLTTGFDAPATDLIAFLRPTLSPGLYLQMAGRGLRVADGKADCLVLDFAGNVSRHGPITAIEPPRKARKGDGEPRTKTCPQCEELVGLSAMTCPSCGHQWEREESQAKPLVLHSDDIMGIEPQTMNVTGWQWRRHTSRTSGRDMLRVTYYGALSDPPITQYHCILHDGYAGAKARRTLDDMIRQSGATGITAEAHIDSIAVEMNRSRYPQQITYKRRGKFYDVLGVSFDSLMEA